MMFKLMSFFNRRVQVTFLFLLVLFSFSFMWQQEASAQNKETAFQLQQFRPWGDPSGMFQSQGAKTQGEWKYFAGVYFNYSKDPLILRNLDGSRAEGGSIISHQVGADLLFGLGVMDWIDVYLSIPMTLYQSGGISSQNAPFFSKETNKTLSGFAFSDIKLAIKAQILKEEDSGINLAAQIFLGVPTGDTERFNGEDGVSFGVSVFLDKKIGSITLAFNLGYLYLPPTKALNLVIQHELTYSLGVRYELSEKRLDLIADLAGAAALSSKTSIETAPIDFYLGVRFYPLNNTDLALNLGFGLPFSPGYGSPQVRVFFGVTYAPRDHDMDKDGIFDPEDRCVKIPGPHENNGCPWPDTDGDGLKDNVDKCPKVKGLKKFEGCPDTDGDGIVDSADKCPKKFGPKELKGCPWEDTDKDGLKDNVDKCPKKAGPKENKGCPWPDTDKDGLTDNIDKCPKKAGPKENRGCPDTDRDGDKVVDRLDKCPDVPGLKEKQGCPKIILAKRVGNKIQILQKIFFRSGSARIQSKSYPILEQVSAVLKSNPEFKVQIEGHTDGRGRKKYNKRLSEQRAKSVLKYLIKKGVKKERMNAEGFGMEKPIETNKTRAGRGKNRRIEFNILDRK